ncbi:hypothetical protein H2198_004615 [Neophaeococcomyces mojaviensis]|uniref:Uncharacterized protein n=1 Tax=Neophaeococcomyces mojaviensis TaxID=3383035 RepID=A0ACC3A834_9EURO|nr:hypothetical protein H2198_004615 [Knufia sp. JES_112]
MTLQIPLESKVGGQENPEDDTSQRARSLTSNPPPSHDYTDCGPDSAPQGYGEYEKLPGRGNVNHSNDPSVHQYRNHAQNTQHQVPFSDIEYQSGPDSEKEYPSQDSSSDENVCEYSVSNEDGRSARRPPLVLDRAPTSSYDDTRQTEYALREQEELLLDRVEETWIAVVNSWNNLTACMSMSNEELRGCTQEVITRADEHNLEIVEFRSAVAILKEFRG